MSWPSCGPTSVPSLNVASIRAVHGKAGGVTYEVRWRDDDMHRSRTFKTSDEAERFVSMLEDIKNEDRDPERVAEKYRDERKAPQRRQRRPGAKTSLYRHYNASGVLLYVGISMEYDKRTRAHRGTAPWLKDVAYSYVTYYPDRQLAKVAEAIAVRTEEPLHNKIRFNHMTADTARLVWRHQNQETVRRYKQSKQRLPKQRPDNAP